MTFYWLSFNDDQFCGGLIVDAKSPTAALERARELELDPRPYNSVRGLELDRDEFPTKRSLQPFVVNRLYSRDEIEAMDGAMLF